MSRDAPAIASSLVVDGEVDILAAARCALERRWFEGTTIEQVSEPQAPPRTAHFFEADSFMEHDPERLRELVITLLGAAHAARMEVALWLRGERDGVRFRYAVLSADGEVAPHIGADFQRMLEGVFPGICVRSLVTGPDQPLTRDLIDLQGRPAAGVIVGLPSEREDTPVETRLDDVLNALAGRQFDVVVYGQPASTRDVDLAESNLAHLANVAHHLSRQQLSLSDSESLSSSVAEGVSRSWSVSDTINWSTSESIARSKQVEGHKAQAIGVAAGVVLGGVLGAVVGAPTGPGAAASAAAGAKLGAVIGGHLGGAMAKAIAPPVQETVTSGKSEGRSKSSQAGGGSSRTTTAGVAQQWGRSVSVERLNRQAALVGEIADHHLERMRRMKSFGAWHVSVSIATNAASDLQLVSSLLTGALRGDTSHLETLKLVPVAGPATRAFLARTVAFRPEHFSALPHPFLPRGEQPTTLLSSEDLSHWFRPPSSPVIGVDVRHSVSFAAALPAVPATVDRVHLGPLVAGGRVVHGAAVELPTTDLLRHCFIAGTTGAGKTTTLRSILLQLADQDIPFLVVEPAKTEYRGLYETLVRRRKRPLRLSLRGGNEADDRKLRINPWRVPEGAVLGRYVEGMKTLLRSCFAMQESLPQILERAVFTMYEERGWSDLSATVPSPLPHRFPLFSDFVAPAAKAGGMTFLRRIVHGLRYRLDIEANLSAAITTRMESFTRGLKAELFSEDGEQFDEILRRPTFIELADLNEPDIKRFLLGALVMRVATELEVRNRAGAPQGVRHVLVLEEAHHFLREAAGFGPSAELVRESNTLLADAFAEMRAYGEGIIVADQAPAELSPAVLRNTNLKIAHRLLFEQDCRAIGDAMGLDEEQQRQLRALRPGECVVHGPSFGRPVQCSVTRRGDDTDV